MLYALTRRLGSYLLGSNLRRTRLDYYRVTNHAFRITNIHALDFLRL